MRLIAAILGLLTGFSASATTTWSATSTGVKAVCTTGTEAAPSGASAGLAVTAGTGLGVIVEAGSAMTAGGRLAAYVYNVESSTWVPAPHLDVYVSAVTAQAFQHFTAPVAGSRVAWVPSGLGVASTVYISH